MASIAPPEFFYVPMLLLAGLALVLLATVFHLRSRLRALKRSAGLQSDRSGEGRPASPADEAAEAAQLFRAMFESAPYAVTINALDGRYLEFNEAFLKHHGVSREEALKLLSQDMVQSTSEERDRIVAQLKREGRLTNCEATVRRADGKMANVLYSSSFVNFGGSRCVLSITVDVTSLKQAEQEALRWRRKFDLTTAGARLVFYEHDLARDAITWSGSLRNVLGYEPEELGGELRLWERLIHPDDVHWVTAQLAEEKALGRDFFVEYRLRRKDGEFAYVSEYGRFFGPEGGPLSEMLGIIQDVSQRKAAMERLRQSEEKFASIFRFSPDALMLLRLETGIIVDVNEAFTKLFGFAREETIGRTTLELGLHRDVKVRERLYEMFTANEAVRDFEMGGVAETGEEIPCLISGLPMRIGGDACVLAVIRDLREIKRMQQFMIQTEKMQSLGGLAAGMAHEINNPLGIIVQATQNVLHRVDPGREANIEAARRHGLDLQGLEAFLRERNILRYLEGIREAGERAATIVADMLSFSRRSEGVFSSRDLNALVDRALDLAGKDFDLRKQYDFRVLEIVREFCPDLPTVPCVATEIEQVLLNLLRNAAQAMSQTQVGRPAITVRTRREGEFALVEVEDNGPGIPAEHIGHVFEPFFTTKRAGDGTGLGLSVSYFIVTQNHRGRFSVTSPPGVGACFQFALPLRQSREQFPPCPTP